MDLRTRCQNKSMNENWVFILDKGIIKDKNPGIVLKIEYF
jgi:hypothetical protein